MSGENDTQEAQDEDFLDMSDEDFANMSDDELDQEFLDIPGDSDDESEEDESDSDEDADSAAEVDGEDEDDDDEAEADDEDEEGDDEETDDEEDGDVDSDDADDADDASDDDRDDDSSDEDKDADNDGEVDLQAFHDAVTAEFKANGRNMKVDKPEDIVRLMQMGANYNRKMAGMKPHLKMLKMLENAELLSEEKLNFLIDLDQKNPAAIARLLKDSEIDPLEFNVDQGEGYEATNRSVDDRELALDEVVETIKDSETYPQVIKLVTQDWDASSKQAVANEPQLLRVLNDHMASGIYNLISTEIEQERMFGRLDGMSDLAAYQKVGDAIHARGGFDHLNPSQDQRQQSQQRRQDTAAKPKGDDKKRRNKRRAASPSRRSASSRQKEDFNPLAMSDEDFLAQADDKFL